MSTEFIEQWNSAFPLKLTAVNLQQPNETFLFGALSCFLQHINIDVAKMDEESFSSEENRLRFKAEFCHYIDQLVKISNQKDNFVYYDLVCPAPKKTIYVLKLLLNYYNFYLATRDEIVGDATDIIEAYEAAQLELNQFQRTKVMQSDQLAEHDKQTEFLRTRIPFVQKNIDELQNRFAITETTVLGEQKQLTEAKLANLALEQRLVQLRDDVVTDEEAAALMKTIADLDAELNELEVTERDIKISHREVTEQIAICGKNIEHGERLLETFTVESMTSSKALERNVADAEQQIAAAAAKRAALLESIGLQRLETDHLQRIVDEIAAKLSAANQTDDRQLSTLKRDKQQALDRLAVVEEKLRRAEAKVAEAEAEQVSITAAGAQVLRSIRDSR